MRRPERLVRRFYDEVWNREDTDAARAILHADFRFRGSLGPERVGPEGFIAYMRAVHAALGDYRCDIVSLVGTDTRAAARMDFHGIHRGDFFGVPATGRTIRWSGAAFFETRGDRLGSLWVLGDVDAMKAQLGAGGDARFG